MTEFYMGQVMMTGFGFAPNKFAQCDGAYMSVAQNQALFSLLGTTFGGNGQTVFQLPDLRGRTPFGAMVSVDVAWQPPVCAWGMIGGVENISLFEAQNGPHTHAMTATTAPGVGTSVDGPYVLALASEPALPYRPPPADIGLGGGRSSVSGSSAPHPNMQPYVVINFNIALTGIYPMRS